VIDERHRPSRILAAASARLDPSAEARFFAEELRRAGYAVRLVRFCNDSVSDLPSGLLVLRVSDPVMLAAV